MPYDQGSPVVVHLPVDALRVLPGTVTQTLESEQIRAEIGG
jgi:hypothetical protein